MKTIIKRNLDISDTYVLIDKKYIPVLEGGAICQDCGKLISKIAIVKAQKQDKQFSVGFDCYEKLLKTNELNETINVKNHIKEINKVINFSKTLKKIVNNNPSIDGFYFEPQSYKSDWFTYYIIRYKGDKGYNMSVKLKNVNYEFLHNTIKNIMSGINIYYGER